MCGKNISRAGDMLKHRQTLTCRTNLRDSLVQGSSRLVVTVLNYPGALDTVLRETVESWQKEENDVNSNLVRSQHAEVIEDMEEDYEERDLVIDEQAREQVIPEDQ